MASLDARHATVHFLGFGRRSEARRWAMDVHAPSDGMLRPSSDLPRRSLGAWKKGRARECTRHARVRWTLATLGHLVSHRGEETPFRNAFSSVSPFPFIPFLPSGSKGGKSKGRPGVTLLRIGTGRSKGHPFGFDRGSFSGLKGELLRVPSGSSLRVVSCAIISSCVAHLHVCAMSRWGPPNANNPLGVGWGEPVHAATDAQGKVDLERTWEARGDEEESRYAPKVRARAPTNAARCVRTTCGADVGFPCTPPR